MGEKMDNFIESMCRFNFTYKIAQKLRDKYIIYQNCAVFFI